MDWINSPYITIANGIIGLAFLLSFRTALRLVGTWLVAQVICDATMTGLAESINAGQAVSYYYMIACSGIIILIQAYKSPYRYTAANHYILGFASVMHILFGFYKSAQLNHWDSWGESLQINYGSWIDSSLFVSSLAVDLTLIMVGVYSALVPPSSYNNIDPFK